MCLQWMKRHFLNTIHSDSDQYLTQCQEQIKRIRRELPLLPFSNIWVASRIASRIPEYSVIHFAILNSLRSWNFFELPASVRSISNVGGFGIDGALSTLLGASLANTEKLYFGITGDLAFFYDMNAVGNRHIGKNLRIMVVNNGKGTEFRQYNHIAAQFGDQADDLIAASGHYGNKSPVLIKNYVESLGFKYLTASSKEVFDSVCEEFLAVDINSAPIVFEVFTDSDEESHALEMIRNINKDRKVLAKGTLKKILGENAVKKIKKALIR